MAVNCEIIIGADPETGEGGLPIMRGTNVSDSLETDTDNIKCFDEVVPQGNATVGGTLSIEKLSYDSIDEYTDLRDTLKSMLSKPQMITTRETIKFKNDPDYVIVKNYMGCILSSKDYESNPGEHSTYGLEFTYAECDEKDPETI